MADQPQNGTTQPNLPGFGESASEPWALEETLKKVLSTLQKDLAQGTRQGRSLDILNRNIDRLSQTISDTADDSQDDRRRNYVNNNATKKALDDIRKASDRAAKAQEESTRNEKLNKNTARDNLLGGGMPGAGGGVLGFIANAAMKTGKGLLDAGKSIMESGGDIASATQGVAAAIPGIGGLLKTASNMVDNARAQLADLAQTGQTVNYSMMGFANAATQAGLSTKQAADIIKASSETAAKLGTTGFLDLQMQVRRVTERFGRFGYSLDDQAKITANFYETQMSLGRRDTARNSQAIADYTAKLSTLSKLTGKSVDTLLAEQKAIADSPDVYAAATRVFQRSGETAARNFENVVAEAANKLPASLQDMSTQMLSDYGKYGSIASSQLGQALVTAGRSDIVNQLDQAIASGNSDAYAAVMKRVADEAQDFRSPVRQIFSDIASSTGPLADAIKPVITGMRDLSKTNEGITNLPGEIAGNIANAAKSDTAAKDQNDTQVQIALSAAYAATLAQAQQLQPVLQQLTIEAANMTAAFLSSEVVTQVVNEFATSMVDATQHVSDFISTLTLFDSVGSGLSYVIGKLMEFGGWLGRFTGIGEGLGKILTAAGAWFGGKKLAGSLLGMGGRAARGAAGAGAAGGAAQGGLMAGLRGLAGGGIRGLASGAARGLLRGGLLGAAFEGLGYLGPNGKALTGRNVLRSGISLLGGAAGGVLGSIGGPVGTVAGGALGYAGAKYLADKLLGPDDMKQVQTQVQRGREERTPPPPRPIARVRARPDTTERDHLRNQEEVTRRIAEVQAKYRKDNEEAMAAIRRRVEAQAARPPAPIQNTGQPARPTTGPAPASIRRPESHSRPMSVNEINKMATTAARLARPTDTSRVDFPVGDEMQNRQLQEMQTTNKLLAGIYVNGRPVVRPKPSVVMYNGGWY